MVQTAIAHNNEAMNNKAQTLSTSDINSQIHSTIQEAIKTHQKSESETEANSKLGFLQKVVTLDCFFGSSECLFKDKKSMMAGEVTEFAKKKFKEGNRDVNQYLAQVKAEITDDLKGKEAQKLQALVGIQDINYSDADIILEFRSPYLLYLYLVKITTCQPDCSSSEDFEEGG